VLEGCDRFDEEYAVGGPVNPKTGRSYGPNTKAFAEWAASWGKQVLPPAQYELVLNMARGVRSHQIAADLLSSGIPETVVRTQCCGVPSQIRVDWVDPCRCLIDLKTIDNFIWFQADAKR